MACASGKIRLNLYQQCGIVEDTGDDYGELTIFQI